MILVVAVTVVVAVMVEVVVVVKAEGEGIQEGKGIKCEKCGGESRFPHKLMA